MHMRTLVFPETDLKRFDTFMLNEWPPAIESSMVIEAPVLLQFSFLLVYI